MNTSPILWILAAFSGIGAEMFHVVQKLPRILVEETQSVLIPCKWTGNVSRPIGSYRWLKGGRNGTEVSGQTAEYRGRVHRSQEDFFNGRDASLLLKELKVTDSGMYYCSVKIMELGEEYGAGTQLTVRAKTKGAMTLWSFLLISALVHVAFLFIFVVYCVKLRRTKDQTELFQKSPLWINQYAGLLESDDLCNYAALQQKQSNQEQSLICVPKVGSEEETSIYLPMESLKTFSNSTANVMGK
ncbi:hypothetical protein chiPu_0017021 [Chiloscyllium punctatum]|uniref:Natural cytotoxicity triggering receptor 3 n=1 Tax=Chiloscyllium punctatum TaxID=137246 RepID=A0A401T7C5_CHIPU|nr:hypothetical protein [Chiloscyllium punctatum]